MRAVVQRVREARVDVDRQTLASIGPGLLVLVGIGTGDRDDDRDWLVRKIVDLRIFDD
ncbi:MAG TPA: D-aminoacyl-tRNA deacylase, partial [Casimicrobiaceae bacterium]|nr:D-aminoacyl-tRNA deacylase [Casimicrobiaceae bacterium]